VVDNEEKGVVWAGKTVVRPSLCIDSEGKGVFSGRLHVG